MPPMRCVALIIAIGIAAGCARAPDVGSTMAAAPAGSAMFEFNLLFVEADLGEERILCLIDTGATASAIDSALAQRLGLESAGETSVLGTTGEFIAPTVRVPSVAFVGFASPPIEPTSYDLSGMLAPEGRRVGMILGYDALRRVILGVDFERARVAALAKPPRHAWSVPMSLEERVPILEAALEGEPVRLRIDTGASLFETDRIYINMTEAGFEAALKGAAPPRPVERLTGTGAGGASVELPVHELGSFALGGREMGPVRVIVQPRAGYFAREDALGFVSNNLLRRLGRIAFDYPGGRLLILEE